MSEKQSLNIKKKLTISIVNTAVAKEKRYYIQDTEIPGFALKIEQSGHKTYIVDYREGVGRTARKRTYTIGPTTILTPDQARDEAKKILAMKLAGASASEIRDKDKEMPNFSKIADRYIEEWAKVYKKETSIRTDENIIRLYLKPTFGNHKADAITDEEVKELFNKISKCSASGKPSPIIANRMKALLSKIMNLCEEWKYRERNTNPCKFVRKNKEQKRKRYLSPEHPLDDRGQANEKLDSELFRFINALSTALRERTEKENIIYIFTLLLLTGARRSEIVFLKWEELDLRYMVIKKKNHKTDSTTKSAYIEEKEIALNSIAAEILTRVEKTHDIWVFPSHVCPDKPYNNLTKAFNRILKMAQIKEFRLHDSRHTFASILANKGQNLSMIGSLLGHQSTQTTQGYTHLFRSPKISAAEEVGDEIKQFLQLPNKAKIIPFPGTKR